MELTIEEKMRKASEFPGMEAQIKIKLVEKSSPQLDTCFPADYKEYVPIGQIMWENIGEKHKFEDKNCRRIHPSNNIFCANFDTPQFEVLGIYDSANRMTHFYDAQSNKFIKYVTSSVDEVGEQIGAAEPRYKKLGVPPIPEGLDVHLYRCETGIYENSIGFGIKAGSTVWATKAHASERIIKLFNDVHSYNFPTGLFTHLGQGVGYGGDTAIKELPDKIEEQIKSNVNKLKQIGKPPLIPEDCFKTPNDTDVSTMKNIEI